MKDSITRIVAFLSAITLLVSCHSEDKTNDKAAYMKAFADTYGVIRWFYPGDEAQTVDWNALAVYGVHRIEQVNSNEELQSALQDIFYPIASGVAITTDAKYDTRQITPENSVGMKEIAWQHSGVDLGKWSNSYVSKRTYRDFDSQGINRLAFEFEQPAANYIGKELIFEVDIDNLTSSTLKVYAKISLDDNGADEYINFCEYSPYNETDSSIKKIIKVGGEDSNKLLRIGIYTTGVGEFRVNYCRLNNSDLLADSFIRNYTVYNYSNQGREVKTKDLLYEEHSHIGEVKSLEVIDGLYVHVPLALYGSDEYTYPVSDKTIVKPNYVASVDAASERDMMLADIVVTWNVINYFHPYLSDEVNDWGACLLSAINEVYQSDRYSLDPLRRMMANVKDAHFVANSPRENKDYNFLPIRVHRDGNHIIVTNSLDKAILPGDEIIQVNGGSAIDRYIECEELVSGSPQYKSHIAEQIWLRENAPKAEIALERNGKHHSIIISSIDRGKFISDLIANNNIKQSRWLNQDTLYLNTRASSLAEIIELLKPRKKEQTVLIDIRDGSSFMLMNILPYIADERDLKSFRECISQTPMVYKPETPSINDTLDDVEIPSLQYNNIFITGPMNYSHDEEVVDYALYCGIAKTAGAATAGCNGRVNRISLPSEGFVNFTGRKVFSNLGKRGYYYGRGIPATENIDLMECN